MSWLAKKHYDWVKLQKECVEPCTECGMWFDEDGFEAGAHTFLDFIDAWCDTPTTEQLRMGQTCSANMLRDALNQLLPKRLRPLTQEQAQKAYDEMSDADNLPEEVITDIVCRVTKGESHD